MGVMTCSRNSCGNIMCNTYVDGVGYVCHECQSEFKVYLEKRSSTTLGEGVMKKELDKFMDTEKDRFTIGEDIDVEDFFESYRKKD